jgi:hypothetical protein
MKEALLICLRIKGYARPALLAECLHADLTSALETLSAEQAIEETKIGLKLTPHGQALADEVSRAERQQADSEVLNMLYQRFTPLNAAFKALVSRWQMRNGQPNDHSDHSYDAAIFQELGLIDSKIKDILSNIPIARISEQYMRRFTVALERLTAGDLKYMAAPILDSYHTVWFELHEDLIRTSGKTRAEEARLGHAT